MPCVMNAWYCAGWSADLSDTPMGIRIADTELVIYRRQDGTAAALSGICPHRFAPLKRGKVKGDRIECGYHGLQFDASGACVHNPHGKGILPPRSNLRRFPVRERSGAIWVWMGAPGLIDESGIVDFDFVLDRRRWAGVTGYLKINANYQLIIDNLLDLSHAAYIHGSTLSFDADEHPDITVRRHYSFRADNGVIHSDTFIAGVPPTPTFALFSGIDFGDINSPMALHLPSSLILDLSYTKQDSGAVPARMPSAHLLAPETETTTHYFYAISRNMRLEDDAITKAIADIVRIAFVDEDEPMIHDCFDMMEGREFFSLSPAILETDVAAIHARKAIAKMLRDEQAGAE